MLKVKINKRGKKLDMIQDSIRKLDGQKTQAGFFQGQGKHKGSGMSYAGLAKALATGYFPMQEELKTPMPFLDKIGDRAILGLGRSMKIKRAYRMWGRKLDKRGNPLLLLNAIGEYVVDQSKDVFNNPMYFPEVPRNKTPLYETGELASKFTYRTSWDNRVRRT